MRTTLRYVLFGAAVALTACAGSQQATRPGASSTPGATAAGQKPSGPPPLSPRAKVLFEDANEAFAKMEKSGRYDWDALARKYDAALAADGRLAEADYNLGVIAERQGNTDAAIAHYKAALKTKPSLKDAAVNLAVIAQNRGDTQSAIATLGDIARQFPEDAASRAQLASVFLHAGDPGRALGMAKEALARDPKSVVATKVMLEADLALKQYSVAQLVFLRANKLAPEDPELYYDLGLIHLAQAHAARAQVQFEKALGVKPDFAPALAQLAKIALAQESYPAAEGYLRKLLQVDGKNAAAHLNLAVALKGLGQFDQAMQEYDAAEKLDPNMPAVYLDRAILLARHKDAPDRALELYKKYVALSGGELALPHSAPVFGLMREAKQAVAVKEEARKIEEEAKRVEEAAKAQQAAQKAAPQGQVAPASGTAANAAPTPAGSPAPAKPAPAKPAAPSGTADEPHDAM
jgi:tetratricopeptide (TPR) repeat protein